MPYVLIFFAVVFGAFALRHWLKKRKRARILATPLSDREREIVLDQVPLTQRLPAGLLGQLEGRINLFRHQVDFIGCAGQEVTEEMELSIAAQACLLVVNTKAWYNPLRTVLIYPSAFRSVNRDHDGYVVTERESIRIGESWAYGPVILSWADTEQGALNDGDGKNVVLHEFAHQLDTLSGHTNGIPILGKGQTFAEWNHVISNAYERHVEESERGRNTVLDAYGAQNEVEFFAVAVEAFFEKPEALHLEEAEVYEQLSKLFQLNPIAWDQGP